MGFIRSKWAKWANGRTPSLRMPTSCFEGRRGRKKAGGSGDEERLYRKIGRLKIELDWLKKKSGVSL